MRLCVTQAASVLACFHFGAERGRPIEIQLGNLTLFLCYACAEEMARIMLERSKPKPEELLWMQQSEKSE